MKRRHFITLVVGALLLPVATNAQQLKKTPRVGVLWHAGSAEEEDVYLSVLRKSFNDLGYIEGKTIELQHREPSLHSEGNDTSRKIGSEACTGIFSFRQMGPS